MIKYIMVILSAVALSLSSAAPAQAISEPVLVASHPSIVSEPNAAARWIKDLAVKDGKVYMGYGNYSVNSGNTDLAYYDTATGGTGVAGTTLSEEVNTYRSFDGELYVPWIDPTLCATCGPAGVNGGFSSSNGGWHDTYVFPASHVYDFNKYGNDWFLAGTGAHNTNGAVIYRSTNGGATWTLSLAEASSGGNITGYERFYWMAQAGGKLYAQAAHKDYSSSNTGELFPLRVWNGSSWAKVKGKTTLGHISEASNVESFNGKIYTSRNQVFDGSRVVSAGAPFTIADFYKDGSRLYIVSSTGQVAYTTGTGWTTLPGVAVPAGQEARSIAVIGSSVYVGTKAGTLYRSTL